MTDKELLELAAKSAGIEIYFDEDGDCYRVKASGNRNYWDPLNYDGDALRLAVGLKMDIEHVYEYVDVSIYDLDIEDFAARVAEDSREDPCAATRRAIVRAAAKIGRSM